MSNETPVTETVAACTSKLHEAVNPPSSDVAVIVEYPVAKATTVPLETEHTLGFEMDHDTS